MIHCFIFVLIVESSRKSYYYLLNFNFLKKYIAQSLSKETELVLIGIIIDAKFMLNVEICINFVDLYASDVQC